MSHASLDMITPREAAKHTGGVENAGKLIIKKEN